VIAYVTTRYDIYRLPLSNGISELPLFPFDEQDIRTAVAVRYLIGAATIGPVNLRLVANTLAQALFHQLQEIAKTRPGFDVSKQQIDTLRNLQIKVAQSYIELTRP